MLGNAARLFTCSMKFVQSICRDLETRLDVYDFSCSSYSHKLHFNNMHTHTKCCLGGEVPKSEVLSSIYRELEDCKKSLSSYLLSKRQVR